MMAKISGAVSKFMPFVTLVDFTTTILPPSMLDAATDTEGYPAGALLVRISYTVAQLGSGTRGLQLILPMGV